MVFARWDDSPLKIHSKEGISGRMMTLALRIAFFCAWVTLSAGAATPAEALNRNAQNFSELLLRIDQHLMNPKAVLKQERRSNMLKAIQKLYKHPHSGV